MDKRLRYAIEALVKRVDVLVQEGRDEHAWQLCRAGYLLLTEDRPDHKLTLALEKLRAQYDHLRTTH